MLAQQDIPVGACPTARKATSDILLLYLCLPCCPDAQPESLREELDKVSGFILRFRATPYCSRAYF